MSWQPCDSKYAQTYTDFTPTYDPGNISRQPEGGNDGEDWTWAHLASVLAARQAAFDRLLQELNTVADTATNLATALRKAEHASGWGWTGDSAEQYTKAVGTLPTYFDNMSDAYHVVALLVAAYAPEAMRVQASLNRLLAEYGRLMGNDDGEGEWLLAYTRVFPDEQTGTRYMNHLMAEINALSVKIFTCADGLHFDPANRIEAAQALAPQPHDNRPLWQKGLDDFTGFLTDAGEGLFHTAANTFDPDSFSGFCESITVDAGVVALLAAAPEGVLGLTGTEVAADGVSAATLRSLGYVVEGGEVVGTGSTTAGAIDDFAHGKYAAGTAGLLSLGLAEPGSALTGADAALTDAEADELALERYHEALKEHNDDSEAALDSLRVADRKRVGELVTDPSNPAQVAAASKEAKAAVVMAKQSRGLVGEPLNVGVGKGVIEPGLHHAGEAIDDKMNAPQYR